ncbi:MULTISPECIES: TetR/AcrR family transcriptional regulator [Actinoalloteichus]|uniref:Transcriptional regulator, TetR family n=1 Tax=Actinoalloteichus fjordicus TaxID=1612552 RepID=A0AAC9L982_9PSEU|nr:MULTISPECIES: TetR/AcrR family transcriptional regulator [Actinoalloteichus]APU13166.1 transcriptional regulator, TetR family [Actinoalloteichus fjordicus]APU19116.1 transcriptional regulator, TetR family [Actinoalloteichus sp. GBA129-24]
MAEEHRAEAHRELERGGETPEGNAHGVAGRPAGRPRDAHIDTAVTAATLELLEERGYLGVSLGEVARRAGTSRPAIYRRRPGRAALVLAAIESRLDVPAPPDTGCTLCDLGESLTLFLTAYRTIRPDAFSALYAECIQDPELHDRYLRSVIEPSRKAVRETLLRAVDRGDVRRDVDVEQLLDVIASFAHYRALFGRHLDDESAEQVIETLLRGAAIDYAELLSHSEALEQEHLAADGSHQVSIEDRSSPAAG